LRFHVKGASQVKEKFPWESQLKGKSAKDALKELNEGKFDGELKGK